MKITLPQGVALVFAGLLAASYVLGAATGNYELADRATAPGILGITFLLGVEAKKATERNGK